jgi:hypothetical protein
MGKLGEAKGMGMLKIALKGAFGLQKAPLYRIEEFFLENTRHTRAIHLININFQCAVAVISPQTVTTHILYLYLQ